jgi:hypothetical protein
VWITWQRGGLDITPDPGDSVPDLRAPGGESENSITPQAQPVDNHDLL